MTAGLLLNTSNLHVGGGVQVASSVISEITNLDNIPAGLTIWASTEVDINLKSVGCNIERLPAYEVVNTYGIGAIITRKMAHLNSFDSVFTLFGPLYQWGVRPFNIVGFAQPWIIYKENEVSASFNLLDGFINNIRRSVQLFFFCRADQLVVELEHVRDRLVLLNANTPTNIKVVYNSLSSIYCNSQNASPMMLPSPMGELKLGFLGRNYPHKNVRIFPDIVRELKELFRLRARFYVTFTEKEWAECSEDFRSCAYNVGVLTAAQCPSFYRSLDAVVFPSLLECFSATPLEAMAMEKPLFASERPFNRNICADHAYYFDPLDPKSAAEQIARVFRGRGPDKLSLKAARDHALRFSNARDRALEYLNLLEQGAAMRNPL